MDYLMFCTGECDDALRDRYFYLVRGAVSEDDARWKLGIWFHMNDYSDLAEYYSVFVTGENLKDGAGDTIHYCYNMEIVE